jgi:two-component system NtrC family sensor kinase
MSVEHNHRILLIDDMPAIHEDFRKILIPEKSTVSEMDEMEALLFNEEVKAPVDCVELDSAYQGQEGLQKVRESIQNKHPYALAFVDMRMPPGWDGVETIGHLWQEDPDLQIVICTAYSDYSWEDMLRRLDTRDRLLILKNPFDKI